LLKLQAQPSAPLALVSRLAEFFFRCCAPLLLASLGLALGSRLSVWPRAPDAALISLPLSPDAEFCLTCQVQPSVPLTLHSLGSWQSKIICWWIVALFFAPHGYLGMDLGFRLSPQLPAVENDFCGGLLCYLASHSSGYGLGSRRSILPGTPGSAHCSLGVWIRQLPSVKNNFSK